MKKKGRQLTFEKVNGWGGKRRGSGRPNKSGRVNHMRRSDVKCSTPLHLTWRLKNGKVSLRSEEAMTAFCFGAEGAKQFGLRLLHFSLQNNHVHMIAEANNNDQLTRGMRSFGSSFGKAIRKLVGGSGSVFHGRFHLEVLDSPTKMKNAMAYVLQNTSKHTGLIKHVDRYSSAPYFGLWRDLLGLKTGPILVDRAMAPLPTYLCPPRSWLAKEGWMRARS